MNIIKKSKTGGFTLVELLAVVAIIAVLTAVVVNSIGNAIQASEQAAINRQVQVLNSAYQSYMAAGGAPVANVTDVVAALQSNAELVSGITSPFILNAPPTTMPLSGVDQTLAFDGITFSYTAP